MATPIVEQIAANLLTTLSGYGSYENAITFERSLREGHRPRDLFAVIQGVNVAEDTAPHNLKQWRWTWHVMVLAAPAEGSTTETQLHQAIADIAKALLVDPKRGGLAIDTYIGTPFYGPREAGEFDSMVVPVDVQFRTSRDDWYSAS